MRKYLIPEGGNFYKANMHCHSVISDGNLTVEQLKDLYKSHGYSIVAFTDHNLLVDHSDLNDENFMAITGYEADINDERYDRSWNHTPCTHICFYAKDPHNDVIPCYNPKYVFDSSPESYKNAQKYLGTPDYTRNYHNINNMIKEHNEHGFLACFNHPTWSIQDLDDFRDVEGIFAMEVYNHGCFVAGYPEINEFAYEEMYRRGKKISCIASDDNHNRYPEGHPQFDSCGGFIMIKADKLEYGTIMQVLENGDFYASMGPEIYELYVEDEVVHVKTSPAKRITLLTYGRRCSRATGEKDGELITEAALPTLGLYDRCVRIRVEDEYGRIAWTKAYFDACGMENGRYDNQAFRR
ncbi:MAG: PHP domain-containing protein [Clostridia bacterium]|nr:PHP domain-containing protein [Clostridia bacterium]